MKRIGDRPILAMLDIRQLARDHGMTLGSREQGAGKVELRMAHECGPAWRDCRSISRGWPRVEGHGKSRLEGGGPSGRRPAASCGNVSGSELPQSGELGTGLLSLLAKASG